MFSIGDKIVYPLYGAGIIEDLQEKEVDGKTQSYYVLRIPIGDLKIMISAAKAESLGIREIYPGGEVMGVITGAAKLRVAMPENWNLRYKENMERIKSGKLDEVTLVFRSLRERERARGLSTAEKKMMTTAKNIILSELMLALDIERTAAEEMLAANTP